MSPRTRGTLPAPGADWAYFFDIDGTLAEIACLPGDVRVDPALRRSIEALFTASGGALALVSGRSIREIDALFPGVPMPVAGQHGTERRNANGAVVRHDFPAERLGWLRERLAALPLAYPGLHLEDKGSSLALHYRNAPRLAAFVHHRVRSLAAESGTGLAVQAGKRVIELVPDGQSKGGAVLSFLGEPPFRGRLPVFVGDDVTDETAFDAVNRLDGLSVKVGPGRTMARWRLRDVSAVRAWLEHGSNATPVAHAAGRRIIP